MVCSLGYIIAGEFNEIEVIFGYDDRIGPVAQVGDEVVMAVRGNVRDKLDQGGGYCVRWGDIEGLELDELGELARTFSDPQITSMIGPALLSVQVK